MARRFVLGLLAALALGATAAGLLLARGDRASPPPGGTPQAPIATQRLLAHLGALERIANEHGGTRASGTAGYEASVRYVVAELREAGYEPILQRFAFPFFAETAPPRLDLVEPRVAGELPPDVVTIGYSATGDVRGRVVPVDVRIPPGRPNSSSSGCDRSDFEGFPRGAVALVQQGGCFLFLKAENAERAGASAVVVFNEGQPGRRDALPATLGRPGISFPVIGVSYEAGRTLAELAARRSAVVRVAARTESGRRETANVLAALPGRDDETVVLGAHLDSVMHGPGISDNGTGVAAVLEVARATRRTVARPKRTVVFAFLGGRGARPLGFERVRAAARGRRERARRGGRERGHARLEERRPFRLRR